MDAQQLFEQIKKKRSFLCVGLDTEIKKLPSNMRKSSYLLFEFNKKIIDATAPYTVAYKPNLAFYEAEGINGLKQLGETVSYIRNNYPDIFIIADAKRGDIGNTSQLYADAFFKNMDFDAITLSPYMGKDTVEPFLSYADKWVILLALTSNLSASDFQLIENKANGLKLYEQVLETSKTWGSMDNTMYVVGATKAEMLTAVRKHIPDHFLLIPGVGAQGGSLSDVAKYGINRQCGLLVNSSRAIIYADSSERFDIAAGIKAKKMQQEMEELLKSFSLI
ncbi:MAG: orotidine-5'-phosphate decarboxylase [Prevotellaceae bacterium]|jgi:orotidine-5'-phosphate decarboxylase|nr:orotidine-5'-phosphate decarboxylase [Prevotellaceae bacterium]